MEQQGVSGFGARPRIGHAVRLQSGMGSRLRDAVLAAAAALLGMAANASGPGGESGAAGHGAGSGTVQASGHAAEHGETHAHRNELALFLGVTNVDNDQRPTLGIDYERRLGQRFGAGVVADWAFGGDEREFILAPAGYWHPTDALRFTLAAGIQRDRERREIEGVARLGAEYLFELQERWTVAPGASLDFVAGETITVFGVAVGYAF